MSIDITIHFQDHKSIELSSGCRSSRLRQWNLHSSCLNGQNKVIWEFLKATYTLPSEEFIELVGSTVEEAKEIILRNNSSLTIDDCNEYITLEVKYFYDVLKTNKLKYVEFEMVDQS